MSRVKKASGILSLLEEGYRKHPRSFSLIELAIYTGIFAFYMWVIPFWFWGIYRLDLAVPKTLETLFYFLWRETELASVMVAMLGLCFFALTFLIRNDSLKKLGIRFDNLRASGRECFVIFLILACMILLGFILYSDTFSPHSSVFYLRKFYQGVIQQFLLQSVVLLSFLRIFGKRSTPSPPGSEARGMPPGLSVSTEPVESLRVGRLAEVSGRRLRADTERRFLPRFEKEGLSPWKVPISVVSTAVLFSLAHLPNLRLMILTFFFGGIGCVLFLRNRNLFTLGMMHGFLSVLFSSLLVPGLIYDFRIGPWTGSSKLFAQIDYDGGRIEANPSKQIVIPIFVINKGKEIWDSKDIKHPVLIGYHILDENGEMMVYENNRTSFDKVMRSEDSARVDLIVYTPPKKGEYTLEVDVVKEKISWFKDKGTKTKRIPLTVN